MNRYRLKLLYDVRISEVLSYNNNNNNSKQLRLNVIATTSDSLEIDLSNMQVMRRKTRDSPSEKKEQDEREEKKNAVRYTTFRHSDWNSIANIFRHARNVNPVSEKPIDLYLFAFVW